VIKRNPFKPSSVARQATFAGRIKEKKEIVNGLCQAVYGTPYNFIITGERGVGKTSLAQYIKDFAISAEDEFTALVEKELLNDSHDEIEEPTLVMPEDIDMNFLVISSVISENTDVSILINIINGQLSKELAEIETLKGYAKKFFGFLKNVKFLDSGYHEPSDDRQQEEKIDDLAREISDVCIRLIEKKKVRNGILLIFDEASEVSDNVNMGFFFKTLTQLLDQNGCSNYSCILVGLDELKEKLVKSHESSSRVFKEINLRAFTIEESKLAVIRGMALANILNHGHNRIFKMDDDVLNEICRLSKGAPSMIQRLASAAFDNDDDYCITMSDLKETNVYQEL
jgi:Cdc6-like AAA superfamily ATPase